MHCKVRQKALEILSYDEQSNLPFHVYIPSRDLHVQS